MLLEFRAALNCELLPRDNCACLLVERLNAGRTIGMIVDRPVDGGKPTPFFGREKSTTIMPAKLALKFDGDMIPAQVRHANPGDCKNDQVLIDMMRQLHQLFESGIRQSPEEWFCSKRVWPNARPDNLEKARRESE